MSSTFHGIEVGKRSLFAQRAALSTTGHNIANANSKGYTRQRVDLQASAAISYPGMNNDRSPRQLGTGVNPSEIVRVREDFLDIQFRGENKELGYWTTTADLYGRIEGIFNEPSDEGLQQLMDQFWQGWQDLAKNPEDLSARAVVRERAVAVADAFRYLSTSLDQLETDLTQSIRTKVSEINSIGMQIQAINDQISRLVPHGYVPNDLYDQRDALIDDLSRLGNVEVRPAANGMQEILIGGQSLVNGRELQTLTFDPDTGQLSLAGNEPALASGELSALLNGRGRTVDGKLSGVIPTMREQLDLYARTFTEQLNQVHQRGVNLDEIAEQKKGNNPQAEQLLFFVDANDPSQPPQGAASMAINEKILASLNKIAAALPAGQGDRTASEGDGSNAQSIAALKFTTISIGGETTTLDGFYRSVVAELGVASQEAQRRTANAEVLVTQVENRRQSVSGVSLDEEMSQMIMYQQAYNAAARFVTTVDETLDKIINGMGRVGL